MTFDAPIPFLDAIKRIVGLKAMPTDQGSAALSSLPADIRKLALFSARTTNAAYLEKVRDVLSRYANGEINMATAKMELQQWLKTAGYNPESGFPGDSSVPPAATQLQNLASDGRIKLVVETLARHAQSAAYLQQGMDEDGLFDFPCWEFRRLYWRRVPRGESGKENDPDWQERWVRSGGTLYDGRMIATKDDDVWDKISDSGIWPDGMDSDCDPVVFNTGYGRIEVPRKECIKLGVIDADENVEGHNISLLGSMFEKDPAKITLADVTAKRGDLLAALAQLKEAA